MRDTPGRSIIISILRKVVLTGPLEPLTLTPSHSGLLLNSNTVGMSEVATSITIISSPIYQLTLPISRSTRNQVPERMIFDRIAYHRCAWNKFHYAGTVCTRYYGRLQLLCQRIRVDRWQLVHPYQVFLTRTTQLWIRGFAQRRSASGNLPT